MTQDSTFWCVVCDRLTRMMPAVDPDGHRCWRCPCCGAWGDVAELLSARQRRRAAAERELAAAGAGVWSLPSIEDLGGWDEGGAE
jgi:hypothetical protein